MQIHVDITKLRIIFNFLYAFWGIKMKSKALSIFLIFLSFVALATVSSAGKEIQLTHDERLTQRTAIYGNYVFWTETTANNVHAFDLTNGERTDINGQVVVDKINAHGNKVVWTGDDGDAVYMYDVSTGNETKIASGRRLPDIYGNYVVYTNNYYSQNRQSGIYLYNLNTDNETKIATVHGYPAIYDKKVIWSQANSNNGYDICEYDISTNQTSIITTIGCPIPESELDIYGDTLVWTESHKVYMYDTASHRKTQVTDRGNAYEPAIYGNWIVYTYNPKENFGGNFMITPRVKVRKGIGAGARKPAGGRAEG